MSKTIIIFFGPPGSGKGTQAEMLAKKTEWKKISTGDLFRAEIADRTKLGKLADKYLKVGKLVPDKVILTLVEQGLKQKTSGFIFDGFPRNRRQLNDLLTIFKKALKKNDRVYALEVAVSDKEVKQRLGQRRVCACGKVYHLVYNPPINQGVCDICGGKLFTRNDDKVKVIIYRLKIYRKVGEPILNYWQKFGKLIKINGEQPISKIHNDIMEKLKQLKHDYH
ncbi:nucleoside monophosphate kinase [Patescibacteria group bacterium]|nr:nucleoside monophosphate kinase [Patescibacteria group bacterium]MBU1663119.1 nucleoside monophosphate kinase [Patescibacteria group bacterium]MBU1933706.1 nucleoside monophosphate kinase [Patescibacteria group bacterium]MBU2008018.1 nucleoside monophosphate kinase [Patescibacteria group bacterium]MBU2233703.1 nucleoside monophosphate kinase [Patescibacteria group bacterium]